MPLVLAESSVGGSLPTADAISLLGKQSRSSWVIKSALGAEDVGTIHIYFCIDNSNISSSQSFKSRIYLFFCFKNMLPSPSPVRLSTVSPERIP